MWSKSFRRLIVALCCLFIWSGICNAQRLVPGQNVLTVSGSFYDEMGGRFNWGSCSRDGRLIIGLSVMNTVSERLSFETHKEKLPMTYYLRSMDIMASGGYLWRLYGTRNRIFNIYGGVTFDLGARVHTYGLDANGYELEKARDKNHELPKVKFIYGFTPRLEFEVFPFRSVSLIAYGYPRVQLYGHRHQEKVFYPEFGLGVNVYFF